MTRSNYYLARQRQARIYPRLETLEDRMAPAAGMLDPTFGTGGLVTSRFTVPSPDSGTAAAVDSLGRTVVAGYTFNGSHNEFAITRYTAVGALDTSFGGTGIVTFGSGYAYGVAVDSLDRVVVAGFTDNSSNADFVVARLTAAGALDASFNSDGILTIDFSGFSDGAYNVAIDSQDRVVVAGSFTIDTIWDTYNYPILVRLTAAGAFDDSFDGDGQLTIDFAGFAGYEYVSGVAVDSLDRVVVAGITYNGNGSNTDFAVARFTTAGALDDSFDGDGKQTIAFGASNEGANGVAVDSLDRVVVAGSTGFYPNTDFAVARLTAAGALDASFDGDGQQTIDFGATNDAAYSVAVDSQDRVVVAGSTGYFPNTDFAVARLTAAGALDANFDGDGQQTIDFGGNGGASGVAVDSQDRVVLAGSTSNGSNTDFAVTRLNAAGALDASFDADGKQTTGLVESPSLTGTTVAVDSRGRTVVAGYMYSGLNYDIVIARYTAAGALDTSFGSTGILTLDFFGFDDYAYGLAVDSLDRVVVAGDTLHGSKREIAVARLTAAGALDVSFDGDGKQTIDFGAANNYAGGVAVDSLDRIVVAGSAYSSATRYDFAVARLTASGALDVSFDGDGKQTIAIGALDDYASGVAVDSLDRVVVAGNTDKIYYPYDSDFAVARLTAAGALDTSFDGDGKQTIDFGSTYDRASDVAVDSLGRVVVGGFLQSGPNFDFAVARFTAAGALDASFDGDGKQTIDFGGNNSATEVAVDSLDRVVLAGVTGDSPNSDFAVGRLTAGGALDASFDGDGKQTIDFGATDDYAYEVAIDSQGRVVVAGSSFTNGYRFAVARLTGDTTIAAAQVNDGSAQRSMVTSIKVTFTEPVSFPAGINAAFQLQRTGPGTPTGLVNLNAAPAGNIVTITFDDPTYAPGTTKSLIDGTYKLTLVSDKIQSASGLLDGDLNGTPGGDLVFNFHRLFGDADGNGSVNSTDLASFRTYFGVGPSIFDFDGNGQTNSTDFVEFRKRFGLSL